MQMLWTFSSLPEHCDAPTQTEQPAVWRLSFEGLVVVKQRNELEDLKRTTENLGPENIYTSMRALSCQTEL